MSKCKELVVAKQKSSVSDMLIKLSYDLYVCMHAHIRACPHTHTHAYVVIVNFSIGQALVTAIKDVYKTSRSKGVYVHQCTDIADKNTDG